MDPSTPPFEDPLEWITAYLTIHSLSIPSRRYSFILWLAVVVIFLAFALLHWTGSRGGLCGALWSKWSLRRRTWRKKHALARARQKNQPHRQPISLPSNAQLLSLTVLTLASFAFAFVGPDYLAPHLKVWQPHTQRAPSESFDMSTFLPLQPDYTIAKSLWSSSARVGQIAFALLPLCVLFALKAPPFALFAIPFMIQLYFDKLAWLHRWAGRLVWFLVFLHVLLWSIQLAKDVNPTTGRVAFVYAWSYTPFIYGWIAFALLTLIILLSLHPIRRRCYELFYVLHVLLVPSMLIMAGLHHPTVAWWCWAALAIWFGERSWRATWWLYANGIARRIPPRSPSLLSDCKHSPRNSWEIGTHRSSVESTASHLPTGRRSFSPLHEHYSHDKSPLSPDRDYPISGSRSSPSPPRSTGMHPPDIPSYVPPCGYAHAELLSGRTVRLRIVTPGYLPWSPGQHFLLNIPSVSRFTSHPFTCASVCDEEAPTDAGRVMVFLVRAKGGWTQELWNVVSRLIAQRSRGDVPRTLAEGLPRHSTLLRTYVDGPFGSAKRARWGNYSTGVIITGGSGVSFGLSILQYMCMCIAGKDGRHFGGRPGGWGRKSADLRRVRFIWLTREYSHVQWCASIIRHCMSIVPPSALQVDIFVTNFTPVPLKYPVAARSPPGSDDELEPPHPNFVRKNPHDHSGSTESLESQESDVDLSYYVGDDEPPPDEMGIAHETNMLDLTNFDGDIDLALPGDAYLSRRLMKEGRLRRMQSRKVTAPPKMYQDTRSHGDVWTPRPGAHQHLLLPLQQSRTQSQKVMGPNAQSTERLLPVSPISEPPSAVLSESDVYSPLPYRSEMPSGAHVQPDVTSPSSDFLSTVSLVTAGGSRLPGHPARGCQDRSEPGRFHAIPVTAGAHHDAHSAGRSASDAIPFEMDEAEAADVDVVSEHARPGKPRLDKVIADEVQASKGAIIVACCGPASLNAMVRKVVAAQIDPGRIRRGDMRGSIALVSEEFEY